MLNYTRFPKVIVIQKAEIDEDVLYTIASASTGISI